MSRIVSEHEPTEFRMGDIIEFDAPYGDHRMRGEIVRIYNTRTVYHAMVGDTRYEVTYADNPVLVERG